MLKGFGLFKKSGAGPESPSSESSPKTPSSPTQAKPNPANPQQKSPANGNPVQRQGSSSSNQQQEEADDDDLFGGMEVNDNEDDEAPAFTNPMKSVSTPAKVANSSATATTAEDTPFFLRASTSEKKGEEEEKGGKEEEESMFDGMNVRAEKHTESSSGVSAFSFMDNGERKEEEKEEEMFEGMNVKAEKENEEDQLFGDMDIKEEKPADATGGSSFSFLTETKSPAPPKEDVDLLSSFETTLAVDHSTSNKQPKDYMAELQDANISLDIVAVPTTPIDEQERKNQLAKRAGAKAKKKSNNFAFQEAESPKQTTSDTTNPVERTPSIPEGGQSKDVKLGQAPVDSAAAVVAAQEKPLPKPPKEIDPSPTKKEDKSPVPKDELATPHADKTPEKKPAVIEDKKPETSKKELPVESVKEEEPVKAEPKKAAIAVASPTPSSPLSNVSTPPLVKSPQKETSEVKPEAAAVVDIAGRLKKIEEDEQNLLKKLTAVHTQVIQFWHSVRDTEAKQLEASEKEEFELAAQLDMSLAHTQQGIHTCERQMEEISASLSEIHDRKTALVRSGLTSRNEIVAKLTKATTDEEKAFKATEEATATEHKREGLRLSMDSERIERERSHVKLERELVEKSKVQLQEKISKEGKEFLDKRDQAVAQKQRVSEKIEELMVQLEQLRQEEQECTQTMNNADSEIKKITELFSEEEKQIESDQKSVDHKESEFQSKIDGIQAAQNKLKETVKLFEAVKVEHLRKMGNLEAELVEHTHISSTLQLRLDLIQQVYKRMTIGLKRGEAPELDRKRQAREDKDVQVKHLAEEEEKIQKAVSDIKRTISASEEKLPELEKQKKLAVSTKNFKEASRVTADIKTITSEKEGQEEKLKSLQQAHTSREQAVIEARNEYRELSEAFDKLERDHDLSVLEKYEQILESSKEEHAKISLLDLPDVESVSTASLKTLASAILQLKVKHSLFSDAKIQSEKGIQELVNQLSTDGIQELKKKLKAEAEAEAPEESLMTSPHGSVKVQEGSNGEEEEEEEEQEAGEGEGEGEGEEEREDREEEDSKLDGGEDTKIDGGDQQPESIETEESKEEEEAENKGPKENIEELKAQVAVLEASLAEAVEADDFELADTLNEQLEELNAKIPKEE